MERKERTLKTEEEKDKSTEVVDVDAAEALSEKDLPVTGSEPVEEDEEFTPPTGDEESTPVPAEEPVPEPVEAVSDKSPVLTEEEIAQGGKESVEGNKEIIDNVIENNKSDTDQDLGEEAGAASSPENVQDSSQPQEEIEGSASKSVKKEPRKTPEGFLRLELLKTDVESTNHRIYTKIAVIEAINHIKPSQSLAVARKNDYVNTKDIHYVPKDLIFYDEDTGILYIEVPNHVVNMAPGHYAVPIVQVDHTHDVLDAKRERVRIINRFRFHEVSLVKDQVPAYEGLSSRLIIPHKDESKKEELNLPKK